MFDKFIKNYQYLCDTKQVCLKVYLIVKLIMFFYIRILAVLYKLIWVDYTFLYQNFNSFI